MEDIDPKTGEGLRRNKCYWQACNSFGATYFFSAEKWSCAQFPMNNSPSLIFSFPPLFHVVYIKCLIAVTWIISPWGTEERTVSTCTEFKQMESKGWRAPEITPIPSTTVGLSSKNNGMASLDISNFNSIGNAWIWDVPVLRLVS